MSNFQIEAQNCANDINNALDEALSKEQFFEPYGAIPKRLLLAMRHGTLNGGKRLRPLLLRQTAAIFNVPHEQTIIAGMVLEMVHCYSLIHDDLPAMDNDDLRRGQKTVHKEFDEATAILAGDNLLTLAFEILASPKAHKEAELRLKLISELAKSAGACGMVGGQMLDLASENEVLSLKEIDNIHAMKTGALIRASVRMGAIIGLASDRELVALTKYGELAGRAFQLADDILDETATDKQLGKTTGKDKKSGKATLVANIGVKESKVKLLEIIEQAKAALSLFGEKANSLRASVDYFGQRES
ncbi:MAG: polyprenyl synthetase family protein [Devosiaceae bacterium]|nr:polyprenyl synthetase family protein [Devosiaceae bacterium]